MSLIDKIIITGLILLAIIIAIIKINDKPSYMSEVVQGAILILLAISMVIAIFIRVWTF